MAEPVTFVAEAVTAPKCDLKYDADARTLRRTDTGALLDGTEVGAYFRTCASKNVHIGGDPQARAEAEREITAFFKLALQRPSR